jgi:hypothetical protein
MLYVVKNIVNIVYLNFIKNYQYQCQVIIIGNVRVAEKYVVVLLVEEEKQEKQ